jgi:hypothetical protein
MAAACYGPKENIVERPRPRYFGSKIDWIAVDHRSAWGDEALGKFGGMTKAYAVPAPSDSALAPLYVRDAIMAAVGVRSSRAIGAAAAARGLTVIGYLPVLSKSARELVMGGDDRHLEFRVGVQQRPAVAGGRELVVATVVHCHNRLGGCIWRQSRHFTARSCKRIWKER